MAVRNVRYFFGRFNLAATYDNKRDYVLQGLRGGTIIQGRGSGWGFFEIEETLVENEQWVYGYLVKYKPEGEEEIVVRETQQIEDEAVINRVMDKSRFFMHLSSGIIAYRPISNQISRQQFTERFVEIFRENHDNFFLNVDIQSITEDLSLLELLRKFSRIQEVLISLHPSNPSNRDVWQRTDERIKALNAATYQEKIEADPKSSGLNVVNDDETTGKITMAVDGYGKAEVRGTLDGETKVVSSDDNPISIQAPNDEALVEDILKTVLLTFRIIKGRFDK